MSKSAKASTLIFDLDGTILDTIEDLKNAVNHILELHNYPTHSRKDYLDYIGLGSKHLIACALGEKDESSKLVDDIFKEYFTYYLEHLWDNTKLFPHIHNALRKASQAGYEIIVFTNKPQKTAENIVAHFFSDIKIKAVISSAEKYPPKPDPTGLLAIMSEYDIDPKRTIYFGDSDYDMEVAKKVDIAYIVGCAYGYQDEERLISSGATHIASSPIEVDKYISKFGVFHNLSNVSLFIIIQLLICAVSLFLIFTKNNPTLNTIYSLTCGLSIAYMALTLGFTYSHLYYINPHILYPVSSSLAATIFYSYLFGYQITISGGIKGSVAIIFLVLGIIFSLIVIAYVVFGLYKLIKSIKIKK